MAATRESMAKRMLKVGFIRRWYARRMVKYIDKSKKKQRRLPDHLYQVETLLKRVPTHDRAKTLADMLQPGQEEQYGREMRRAAARQQRAKGSGGPGKRPGLPPNARQVAKRQVRGR